MRSSRVGLSVTLALCGMLPLTPVMAQRVSTEGVVLAVGWQQGTLLLETARGFSLVAVDPAAKIEDPLGVIQRLSDLQPGDMVEYSAESFGGMLIARELRVVSVSFSDKRLEDERREEKRQ